MLTVIILTFNEEMHLFRCLNSIKSVSDRTIIIDSYSTDVTEDIAKEFGAEFYQHKFINQAKQFQWALDNIPIETDWIMRLDADEYLLPELQAEIHNTLSGLSNEITGLIIKRRVFFMGQWIRFGGYYPIKLLRIWRNGKAMIEQRWMDEHIILMEGKLFELKNDFVDENLHNIGIWTQKHNNYSTREAIDQLNIKNDLFTSDSKLDSVKQGQMFLKRKLKMNLYGRIPLFLRVFIYFIYRYFFQLGFLDGKKGLIWHILQGFWYRFLVDAKIAQIKYLAHTKKKSIKQVITEDFKIEL